MATLHVIDPVSYHFLSCLADADCPPMVPKCYRFANETGMCDTATQRPAGAPPYNYMCSPPCAANMICVDDPGPTPPVSCVAKICAAPTDCPAGSACVPPTTIRLSPCIVTKCSDDAQCTDGPQGRCAAIFTGSVQSRPFLYAIRCVYFDKAGGMHCQGTTVRDLGGGYYACPDLAR
jgi:hypothetical protein